MRQPVRIPIASFIVISAVLQEEGCMSELPKPIEHSNRIPFSERLKLAAPS